MLYFQETTQARAQAKLLFVSVANPHIYYIRILLLSLGASRRTTLSQSQVVKVDWRGMAGRTQEDHDLCLKYKFPWQNCNRGQRESSAFFSPSQCWSLQWTGENDAWLVRGIEAPKEKWLQLRAMNQVLSPPKTRAGSLNRRRWRVRFVIGLAYYFLWQTVMLRKMHQHLSNIKFSMKYVLILHLFECEVKKSLKAWLQLEKFKDKVKVKTWSFEKKNHSFLEETEDLGSRSTISY